MSRELVRAIKQRKRTCKKCGDYLQIKSEGIDNDELGRLYVVEKQCPCGNTSNKTRVHLEEVDEQG